MCLNKDKELKKSHDYYFQVQVLVSGAEFCDFVVYTTKDMAINRVTPDNTLMKSRLLKLSIFYWAKTMNLHDDKYKQTHMEVKTIVDLALGS